VLPPGPVQSTGLGAQLDQVLAYLDRVGVTEIVLGVGRPLTILKESQYVPITKTPLTTPQLGSLLGGTPLAALVPEQDGSFDPVEIAIGTRRICVRAGRRGGDILLRISRPEEKAAPPVRARAETPPPIAVEPRPSGLELTDLGEVIRRAVERGASDVHLASGRPVLIRVLGELVPLDPTPLSHEDVERLLASLLATHRERLASSGYVDLAIESPAGAGRLRANVARFQGGLRGTFRIARVAPPTLEELGLPRELAKVIGHHQGLVVIAGPSGHGKTTTLAALVELINEARPFHIITVEDPVEIVYPRMAAIVSQREVGAHTRSFAAALKASLREDPDVIVIGELRDRETVEIALTAAETGHLVLATMSTPSAAKTIDRLIDMFPPDDQAQVRASISGALRAIVAQRLVAAADGSQRVAAVELLTGCLPLAAMIRDDKLFQLPNLMQRGRAYGMIRLDDSLLELVRSGKITADTALAVTESKKELAALLKTGGPTSRPIRRVE
jgi:twitching motility protein PilT